MNSVPDCRIHLSTQPLPGALAVITIVGAVEPVLNALAPDVPWPVGSVRHLEIADIDDLLVMRPAAETAVITPHGGPRIVTRLIKHLVQLGAKRARPLPREGADDPFFAAELLKLYPEASDEHDARMLHLLAHAASPLAIPALLAMPQRWRRGESTTLDGSLRRLITPPRVAIVGPPNAGKSTLLNCLVGRTAAIVSDIPGTTRDHVIARVDMAGLVVDVLDTPGLRETDDHIERSAARIAERAVAEADLVVSLAAPGQTFVDAPLRIGSHSDVARRDDASLCISAITGENIDRLRVMVRDELIPARTNF